MAKEATARRRKPEKKVDFIKRNFETMTYREMSEHIGLSPSRIYEIAHHKLKLPPKERKVPTYPFKCEGCGKEEQRTSRRRAAVALCDECRPPVKPGIGKRAYLMRHATHQPWEKITTAVGSLSTKSCVRSARRYAIRRGLPWPVPYLTMEDVVKLAESMSNQPPSPPE